MQLLPDVDPGGPLPEDRELLYPWVGFEIIEDRYEERRNQDQIRRTEDVLLGFSAGARLGYASDSMGSDRDAWIAQLWAQDGYDLRPGHTLFGTVAASGRLEDGSLENGVLEAEARYYWQTTERSKFYLDMSGALADDLDAERQLLLGGDNGLRGYPLRYQAGTSRALLTVEERYYTDWYPFHLFYVGAAAFFDVGRTWGTDITGAESAGWLRDIGIGLRLGSEPLVIRQRDPHRSCVPARRRRGHRRRSAAGRNEGAPILRRPLSLSSATGGGWRARRLRRASATSGTRCPDRRARIPRRC